MGIGFGFAFNAKIPGFGTTFNAQAGHLIVPGGSDYQISVNPKGKKAKIM